MTFRTGLMATSLLVATASLASAEDLPVTGLISFDGAFGAFNSRAENEPFYWSEAELTNWLTSLSARVGMDVAPGLSVQLDGWIQRDDGEGTYDDYLYAPSPVRWEYLYAGGAAHLTYHAGDYLIGIAGGLGRHVPDGQTQYASTYATLALEGGYDAGDVRIVGQAGFVRPVAGQATTYLTGAPFASVAATYYLTPDFAVTASGALSNYVYTGFEADVSLHALLGAELRYKLEGSPLVLSLGYQAKVLYAEYVTNDGGTYLGTGHRVTAGLSIPFGAGSATLRDLDRAAGLSLNDPIYGIDAPR